MIADHPTLTAGNILILRDQIRIEPPNRASVSYDYLAQLVAEHLLLTSPDVDISAALSIMPLTTRTSRPSSPLPPSPPSY